MSIKACVNFDSINYAKAYLAAFARVFVYRLEIFRRVHTRHGH